MSFEPTEYQGMVGALQNGFWGTFLGLLDKRLDRELRGVRHDIASIPAPVVPTWSPAVRALDTPWTNDASRFVLGVYTIELYAPTALVTPQSHADVVAYVNSVAQSNPLADIAQASLLGLSITPTLRKVVVAFIPPGSTAELRSTVSGNGTATYVGGHELTL